MIRVLVPPSRTLYYNDKGHERGLTAELVRDFERYINRKYANQLGNRPITVYIIPTTRDRLLPQLVAGNGDIAAGNLTATDERLKVVDFVAPRDRKPIREIIVMGPTAPQIASLEELSGTESSPQSGQQLFSECDCVERPAVSGRQGTSQDHQRALCA